jgi:hypothetical protein
MEACAEWIRSATPSWTDEQRYRLLSSLHTRVPAASILLFVFVDAPLVRIFALGLVLFTLTSEFVLRECALTLLEKEFSDSTWEDLFSKTSRALGWTLTRPEKMMFNIGLNLGLLILMILTLLRQSLVWCFPIIVLLSLVLFSKGLRSEEIAAPQPENTSPPETPPAAQTPPPAAE